MAALDMIWTAEAYDRLSSPSNLAHIRAAHLHATRKHEFCGVCMALVVLEREAAAQMSAKLGFATLFAVQP